MLNAIDPIVRNVRKELIMRYLEDKNINSHVDWEKIPDLLREDIKKALEYISPDRSSSILDEFLRLKRMAMPDGMRALQYTSYSTNWETNIEKVFTSFLIDKDQFKKGEDILYQRDNSRIFLEKILNNKRILGGILIFISFIINMAQLINDEGDARYIALNIFHFILGAMVCACHRRD